ncbi:hypothetical protein [Paracoccus rhizosphaerae]|uniref:Uncharacterized protein n=1 Tax=Paracoccus rhizosphaerae TaxID=1133347 RepID=A0ABV6CGD3_9RHOB|nr:hypothetical protein [Paracoccus rhizosphaerae]
MTDDMMPTHRARAVRPHAVFFQNRPQPTVQGTAMPARTGEQR